MIFHRDDYTIQKVLEAEKSLEQILIQKYACSRIPKAEAGPVWARVLDHKWFISEVLGRDVGLMVAAVDYMENFYEGPVNHQRFNLPDIRFRIPTNTATVV